MSLIGVSSVSCVAGSEGLTTEQAVQKLALVTAKLDAHLGQLVPSGFTTLAALPAEHELHALIRQAGAIAACALSRDESALAMVQRIFKRLFEQAGGGARLYTQVNVQLVLSIHNVSKKVSRFLTDLLLYSVRALTAGGRPDGAGLCALMARDCAP